MSEIVNHHLLVSLPYVFIVLFLLPATLHAWDTMDPVPIVRAAYVNITNGQLRGFETNVNGREAIIFKKVPYAEPPLGPLRFATLRPLRRRWTGSLDATQYGPPCWSNSSHTTSPQSNCSEDCIHVNVFTSKRCLQRGHDNGGATGCPVLFYIHGGNFLYDSAVMFADRQIVEKYASDEVVFVLVGYRLGALGFLNLGDGTDAVVPRNLGLSDIIFALKWTKREIAHFGGDPERISIMGNSGGGSAVQYLMASAAVPADLFRAGIVSSGSPLLGRNVNVLQSRLLLREFGCLGDENVDPTTLRLNGAPDTTAELSAVQLDVLRRQADCLRNVSAYELLAQQNANEVEYNVVFSGVGMSPLVPAKSFPELLTQIKPRPLLITTTSCEMSRGVEIVDDAFCAHNEHYFDYRTEAAHRLCMHRYNHTHKATNGAASRGEQPKCYLADKRARPLTAEVLHAAAHLTALANTWHGGRSFIGSFRLANHTHHADDLLFFIGLHWTRNRTWTMAERLMDAYYPRMIKNFLRYAEPGDGWEPMNHDGNGFFILDYVTEERGVAPQILSWPQFVTDQNTDTDGIRFWLRDEAVAERVEEWWNEKRKVTERKRRDGRLGKRGQRSPVLELNVNPVDPIVIGGGPIYDDEYFKGVERTTATPVFTVLAIVALSLVGVLVTKRIMCGCGSKAEANEKTGILSNVDGGGTVKYL